MELNWKSNKVYPTNDDHDLFVIAKSYGFCGLLYYQNDNFNDDPDFEPYVENDEGYFDLYDMDIVFNRLGNVNHADTYQYKGREIIVSLGTGRVYDYDNEER